MADSEYPCPQCGAATDFRFTCPGRPYTQDGEVTIMVCQVCDGAIEFYCTNKDCPWWHRSPNRRSDIATMGIAPSWLAQALAELTISEE